MNALPLSVLVVAAALGLAGCAAAPAEGEPAMALTVEADTQPVRLSARVVRIKGDLPPAKGSMTFLTDEAGLRAGAVRLTEEETTAALKRLQRLTGEAAVSVKPQAMKTSGDAPDLVRLEPAGFYAPGSDAVALVILPHTQTGRTAEIRVNMSFVPGKSENGRIQVSATLETTAFEGFREYSGSRSSAVAIPQGFYEPVFANRSMQATLTLVAGRTTVLRLEETESTGRAEKPLASTAAPQSAVGQTVLVFLTATAEPGSAASLKGQ